MDAGFCLIAGSCLVAGSTVSLGRFLMRDFCPWRYINTKKSRAVGLRRASGGTESFRAFEAYMRTLFVDL